LEERRGESAGCGAVGEESEVFELEACWREVVGCGAVGEGRVRVSYELFGSERNERAVWSRVVCGRGDAGALFVQQQ